MKWLIEALESTGYPVIVDDISPRPGPYAPIGVLIHHTATPSSARNPLPTRALVRTGRSDLPGPLCQVLVGANGELVVVTRGRANHAGTTRRSGPIPPGDGNELLIGFEMDYSGLVKPTLLQYAATVAGAAAVLARLDRDERYARGHRETSVTGKWDPGQVDLDDMRVDIRLALNAPATPPRRPTMFLAKSPTSQTQYLVDGGHPTPLTKPLYDQFVAAGVVQVEVSELSQITQAFSLDDEIAALKSLLDTAVRQNDVIGSRAAAALAVSEKLAGAVAALQAGETFDQERFLTSVRGAVTEAVLDAGASLRAVEGKE